MGSRVLTQATAARTTEIDPVRRPLEWVTLALTDGETIVESRRMPGATTAELYDLTIGTPGGDRRRLVLRWFADEAFLREEPEALDRQVAALTALASPNARVVPAPRLIASGPAGMLMTHLPGYVELDPPDPVALRELSDSIHAVDPGPLRAYRYAGYHEGAGLARPSW